MRNASVLIAAVGLLMVGGCTHHDMKNVVPDPIFFPGPRREPPKTRAVDLLFVVDNSGSMVEEQERLRRQFPLLMHELRTMRGGLPDLHIGVTTTDLGTGMFQITYCGEPGGDAGNLRTGNCSNPVGVPYIVDVEALACTVIKDASGLCEPSDCDQMNCAHEPSTTFVVDSQTGCPRCRNYTGESLEDVFSCMAIVGTMGCGFEQPLEAMRKALDNNTANTGFVRETAYLGVVLLTDENDCSASNPQLFDNTQTDMDSTLGPLTSFRCFEHGITCDINARTHTGERHNCVPREDAAALLHPLDCYVQFLRALKNPQMLVVSAIAGPVQPSEGGTGFDVTVDRYDLDYPALQPSCTDPDGSAVPAIRIHGLVSAFHPTADVQEWAFMPVCSDSYAATLTGVGRKLAEAVTLAMDCMPFPLKGCADPGVEHGAPQAAQTCEVNSRCLADCVVTTMHARGLSDEAWFDVPPCLEVCTDGPCPGNVDRARAYAAGHPTEFDAALPVLSCWHIGFEELCTKSNGARLVVSRRFVLPPRSFTDVACWQIARDEQLCNDLQDNDEDCLVDQDDPCCQNSANCVE